MANDRTGFTGTWEILAVSLKKTGPGATGTANSGMIRRPRVCGRTGTKRSAPRYRQAKETKCGEKTVRKSECPIVALKRGNGPYRTPWSEGGAALWTRRRNHAEGIEPHQRVTARRWIV